MRKILQAVLFVTVSLFACLQAQASPICSPPLPRDCIVPQWGVIGPDGEIALDGSRLPPLASASGATRGVVRLMPVAMEAETSRSRGPRGKSPKFILLVDDGRKYAREVEALVNALKKASFDRTGRLVEGGERIARAAEVIRKIAPDHVLSLYFRTLRPLKDSDSEVLDNKLQSIAEVLRESGDYKTKSRQ